MDQANRSILNDLLRSILLGKKNNVGRVDPLKVSHPKIVEMEDDAHNVVFYDVPTSFEESTGESIGTGSLVGRHLANGNSHFFLQKGVTDPILVHVSKIKALPIEVMGAGQPFAQG
jgi:hypothetical protein